MPYEIPQELEYREKIIFGLTAVQLGYAALFLAPALIIFFKTPWNIYVRATLTTILIMAGASFMFLDLKNTLRGWKLFLSFRKATLMSRKMKEYLPIKSIKDGIITVKEGSKDKRVAVLRVTPINFGIKNAEERNAVISGFQKFLDGLEFTVQVMMGSDALNLDTYLKSIEGRADTIAQMTGNPDYKKHYLAYKKHLEDTISNNSMMNRYFYVIIPEAESIGISIQVSVCAEKLTNLNLNSKRLNDEELTQMLAGFFNNLLDDDDKQQHIYDVTEQNILHYIIAPKSIENNIYYVKVNSSYCRVVCAKGYPRTVEAGFLDRIITSKGNFDISLFIEPFPIETIMVDLNRELQKQRADLFAAQSKGMLNPSLEIKYNDTRFVLENLQKGSEKLFNVSFYILCKADSIDELNLLTKKMESELNSLLMIPYRPLFRMSQGLKSVMPLGINELGMRRNITTKALSAFFPFTSQFLQVDEAGVWFGLNKNEVPIIKDIFSLQNASGNILASSGSGKSYFSKVFLSRHLLNGTKVIVLDPQAEYVELCKKFNGQLITISRSSNLVINPLDLMGHDYAEKRMTLMDIMHVMLGELSDIQKAVLDRATTTAYERKGINNNPKTWNNKPPILENLLYVLVEMSKKATIIEKPTYQSLINRLSMYVNGVFSFLNQHTRFDFDNHFVCFNIGEMPKQVKPVIMFLILDFVQMKMREDKERKLFIIDEAWSLLGRAEDASYIFEIVKTCRKYNMGLLLITQDVADLLNSEAGNAVLSNSSYTFLMAQKPSAIEDVTKTFHLSFAEKERLLTCGLGEGILIIGNSHTELKIVASKEEHNIITTNPDELLQIHAKKSPEQKKEEAKQPVVDIKINKDKGFFRKSELTQYEIEYLLNHQYMISSHVGLDGGQRKDYLIKPRSNESPTHYFLIKAIEEHLKDYTDKVELFETTKPDIVFDAYGKKVGVEVETGIYYERDLSRLKNKVRLLKKVYGDDWFFVVTRSEQAYKYKELGKTCTRKTVSDIIKQCFPHKEFPPKNVVRTTKISCTKKENARKKAQNKPKKPKGGCLDGQKTRK